MDKKNSNTNDVMIKETLNYEDEEIDLIDLFFYLRGKIVVLILALIAGALIAGGYTYLRIAPTYQANAYMYMVSASSDSIIDLSDLNIGNSIAEDYQQLLVRRPILENVVDEVHGLSIEGHGSKDTDVLVLKDESQLSKYVSLQILGASRILQIRVITTDPVLSRDIANALANQAVEYIPKITQSPAPTIAEYAVVPTTKNGPSLTKNSLIGGVAAMMIVLAYYVLIYLMDDSINSVDDLEKYFGIVAISSIPEGDIGMFEEDEKKSTGKKKKGGRK